MELFTKNKPEEWVDPLEAPLEDEAVGCEHCNNTGLEPGFSLSEAENCSECGGSPRGSLTDDLTL